MSPGHLTLKYCLYEINMFLLLCCLISTTCSILMNIEKSYKIQIKSCVSSWQSGVQMVRGRVTHICVSKLSIIGSDNDLSPGRRQAINWTIVGILLIGSLGTNFNETFIEIHMFSFTKIHLKASSGKWRPFYLGLNVLRWITQEAPGARVCINHVWLLTDSYDN